MNNLEVVRKLFRRNNTENNTENNQKKLATVIYTKKENNAYLFQDDTELFHIYYDTKTLDLFIYNQAYEMLELSRDYIYHYLNNTGNMLYNIPGNTKLLNFILMYNFLQDVVQIYSITINSASFSDISTSLTVITNQAFLAEAEKLTKFQIKSIRFNNQLSVSDDKELYYLTEIPFNENSNNIIFILTYIPISYDNIILKENPDNTSEKKIYLQNVKQVLNVNIVCSVI